MPNPTVLNTVLNKCLFAHLPIASSTHLSPTIIHRQNNFKNSVITLNKMTNKKCYTVGKVPKSNRKISERGKSIPLTHLYRYP